MRARLRGGFGGKMGIGLGLAGVLGLAAGCHADDIRDGDVGGGGAGAMQAGGGIGAGGDVGGGGGVGGGSSIGGGGTGGAGGTGGSGGEGGAPNCFDDADCGTDTDCTSFACDDGSCATSHQPMGTACTENAGEVCDGQGACRLDIGSICTAPTECASDKCIDGACCGDGCPLVASVVAGGAHNCVVFDTGALKCWGANLYGRLGLGGASDQGDGGGEMGTDLSTVDVGSGRSVMAVAAGSSHTCALLDDHNVKCWGQAAAGQIGSGDHHPLGDGGGEMGDNLLPVDLGTGRTAAAIAAGQNHTCALLDDDTLKCWGSNSFGRLGLGDTTFRGDDAGEMGDALPVVDLGTGRTATSVAAGEAHTCALLDDGSVKCWGYNAYGQLGLGDDDARGNAANEMGDNLPVVALGAGRTAVAITCGSHHTCALLDDDTIKCWGFNNGQLGLEDSFDRGDDTGEMGDDLPAVNVGTGRTVVAVAAFGSFTCALLDDDTAKCWGYNAFGQLGLEDMMSRGAQSNQMGDQLAAIALGSGRHVRAIAPGKDHVCAVLDDLTVKCWGRNENGQLGQGDELSRGGSGNQMGDDLPVVTLL